ncbi:MAG: hypothetical protein ACI9U2_001265 [Bradymonadia bacterium]|jgi:hypothetical protein
MNQIVIPLISMSLLVSVGLGCVEPEPRPTPPNLAALVATYAAPTGEVTRESAQRLVAEAATDLALIDDAEAFIGLINLMFTDLAGIGGDESGLSTQQGGLATQQRGLAVGGVKVDGAGWIDYYRLCPTANGMGARGTFDAIVLIDVDAFEPVVWGNLADCRIDGSGFNGDLALHIEWVDGVPSAVIARIVGQTNIGGIVKDGVFSLRWQGQTVMTDYVLDELGGFLVGVDAATEQLLIEGRNGRFVCDAAGCEGPDGGFTL